MDATSYVKECLSILIGRIRTALSQRVVITARIGPLLFVATCHFNNTSVKYGTSFLCRLFFLSFARDAVLLFFRTLQTKHIAVEVHSMCLYFTASLVGKSRPFCVALSMLSRTVTCILGMYTVVILHFAWEPSSLSLGGALYCVQSIFLMCIRVQFQLDEDVKKVTLWKSRTAFNVPNRQIEFKSPK